MDDDDSSIFGAVNIEFDQISTETDAETKRFERVFRCQISAGGTTMRDDQRWMRHGRRAVGEQAVTVGTQDVAPWKRSKDTEKGRGRQAELEEEKGCGCWIGSPYGQKVWFTRNEISQFRLGPLSGFAK